ncbi:helix-turn-helix transcriptional regulator (plasmid) [Thermoanaerobacterium thermosaccharolyticum]|uniref:helix-turn-helix transcriptional regulator n=1 Tax=Thermoanaerobacterium thermosaccharolyticum TaxID=1517 RepID=UPI003DAA4D08
MLKNELKKLEIKTYIEDVFKEKGIKKSQLARRLGITTQALYNIIRFRKGSEGIETALKIAKALDADINKIYKLEYQECLITCYIYIPNY